MEAIARNLLSLSIQVGFIEPHRVLASSPPNALTQTCLSSLNPTTIFNQQGKLGIVLAPMEK